MLSRWMTLTPMKSEKPGITSFRNNAPYSFLRTLKINSIVDSTCPHQLKILSIYILHEKSILFSDLLLHPSEVESIGKALLVSKANHYNQ